MIGLDIYLGTKESLPKIILVERNFMKSRIHNIDNKLDATITVY